VRRSTVPAMLTVITRLQLKDGAEQEWDTAMRDRLEGLQTGPADVTWHEAVLDRRGA
jgi:hypothetical protein